MTPDVSTPEILSGLEGGIVLVCNKSKVLESPAKGFLEQPSDPPSAKKCGCAEGSEDEGESRETGGGWVKQALKDQAESEMGNMDPGTLWKSGRVVMGTSVSFDSDYQGDDD